MTRDIRIINITHFIQVSLGKALNLCLQRSSSDYISFCKMGR